MISQAPSLWFQETRIDTLADAVVVRHLAGDWAHRLGFSAKKQEDARLVASELAHNHVAHQTSEGRIRLSTVNVDGVPALEITSLDNGPGIREVTKAVAGHRASGHGLGVGLGTVKRLADRMYICSSASSAFPCPRGRRPGGIATIVSAQLWACTDALSRMERAGLDLWAASSPACAGGICGDGVSVEQDKRYLRLIVTDGAGHGVEARRVSDEAMEEIRKWDMLWPLDNIVNTLGTSLSPGRDLALGAMVMDMYTGRLQVAGIGNVRVLLELREEGNGKEAWEEVPLLRGTVLGQATWMPAHRVEYGPLARMAAIIHTDGHPPISRQELEDMEASSWPASLLGHSLFRPSGDIKDDATLVILRWNRR